MNEGVSIEEINQLPKIDLHCHLDGSLTRSMITELLGREVALSELQVADDNKNLAEYLEKFDLPLQCLQTRESLFRAAKDFMLSLVQDNIIYVEVRFAPLLSVRNGMSSYQVFEAVLEGMKEGSKLTGIEFGIIVCAMRHHSVEDSLRMAKDLRDFLHCGLCAFDIAGNEAAYPMSEFAGLFSGIRRMGYPFTAHAGECGNARNIVDSIELGARRIGHGIAASHNHDVISLCKSKHIGIEMCPTSNLQTKAVLSMDDYPIREFIDAGLMVTVNTDNRTVSGTNMSKEMKLLVDKCGISIDELVQIKNVAGTNFCDIFAQTNNEILFVTSAIDNLIKGASGAAIENANLMFGLNEDEALPKVAYAP